MYKCTLLFSSSYMSYARRSKHTRKNATWKVFRTVSVPECPHASLWTEQERACPGQYSALKEVYSHCRQALGSFCFH